MQAVRADYRSLPTPTLDATDPGLNVVLQASAVADATARVAS